MNPPIQEVNSDVAAQLMELGKQSYTDHYEDIWYHNGLKQHLYNQFNEERILKELNEDENILYFFVLENTKPIGFVKIKIQNALPNFENEIGLELEKLYFLKNFTGKGYGTKTIQFVFELAKTKQIPFVWLDVLKNNLPAQKLYQKMGFEIVTEIPFETDKMNIGMYVMKKHIV